MVSWDHHTGLLREVRPYEILDNEPQKVRKMPHKRLKWGLRLSQDTTGRRLSVLHSIRPNGADGVYGYRWRALQVSRDRSPDATAAVSLQ